MKTILFFGMFESLATLSAVSIEDLPMQTSIVTAYLIDEERFAELHEGERFSETDAPSADPRFFWSFDGSRSEIPFSVSIEEQEEFDEIVIHRPNGEIALRTRTGKGERIPWAIHHAFTVACRMGAEEYQWEKQKTAPETLKPANPIRKAFMDHVGAPHPESPSS